VAESLGQAFASIDAVRLVCLGISLYVAALHLTFARRGHAANLWVSVWALATALIQLTQIHRSRALEAVDAVASGRLAIATLPVMLGALSFVVRSLAGRRTSGRALAALVAATVSFGALALLTPAFLAPEPQPHAGPAMPLLLVVLALTAEAVVRESRTLERHDRVVLFATLAVYVTFSTLAVLHATIDPNTPFAAGLGTAMAAIGLSHLVVGHERRLALSQAEQGVQALSASEARLRQLVEHAPVGIISCDASGRVHTVNPRMWDIFGAPEAVRRAAPLVNMIAWNRQNRGGEPPLVERALETGETQSGEAVYTPSWGRTAQLRYVVTPLRSPGGEISGALVLAEDVTERNELERRLRLAQKMEAVGQLAAGIAHEINTPMAYVRSNLRALHGDWNALREELRKDPDSETAKSLLAGAEEMIGDSLEGVERTIAIARDMREFAHSASSARAPVDLSRELETCVRLASSQRPGVRLEESYAELPPLAAAAGQLRQVFLNLILNALQAVEEGGSVAVSSACEGDQAVVRVRDDGCGIPPEIQHRLFEPFFTTKPADQGTGLGLFISYEIVRAHGGELRVESAPGAGSTFEVRLPLRQG
jgi:PAS domain S-box-containing protein